MVTLYTIKKIKRLNATPIIVFQTNNKLCAMDFFSKLYDSFSEKSEIVAKNYCGDWEKYFFAGESFDITYIVDNYSYIN